MIALGLLIAGVVFVLAASGRVSRTAGEYDEHRRVDEWIRELHAEAPHEFVDRAFVDTIAVEVARPAALDGSVGLPLAGIRVVTTTTIENLCHWVQNRGDVSHALTHEAFHFGYPCPYLVVASILRGDGDPRDGMPIEVLT